MNVVFKDYIRQNGENTVYRKMVLALLKTDRSETLAQFLREELARTEASTVHSGVVDGYLDGIQVAQKHVLMA